MKNQKIKRQVYLNLTTICNGLSIKGKTNKIAIEIAIKEIPNNLSGTERKIA